MRYEFTNVLNAHAFHAGALAVAHIYGRPTWVGSIVGWYPETYLVDVTAAYEAHLMSLEVK